MLKPGLYIAIERDGKFQILVFPEGHEYEAGLPVPFEAKNIKSAMERIREEKNLQENEILEIYRFGKAGIELIE